MATRTRESITDSVAFARRQLEHARQDGACKDITFWARRMDDQLDELLEITTQREDATP